MWSSQGLFIPSHRLLLMIMNAILLDAFRHGSIHSSLVQSLDFSVNNYHSTPDYWHIILPNRLLDLSNSIFERIESSEIVEDAQERPKRADKCRRRREFPEEESIEAMHPAFILLVVLTIMRKIKDRNGCGSCSSWFHEELEGSIVMSGAYVMSAH
ncbi:hypothetical protein TNCV_4997851 [Trichonephila clavipes]|nr:hypothetical protein TNCV_4997851 [Trichonephila clavipes]